jgi:regulator of sigma E protease
VVELPEDFLGKLSTGTNLTFFELRVPFIVGKVSDSSVNLGAGLKKGDVFTKLNGTSLPYYDQYSGFLEEHKGGEILAEIEREGSTREVNLKVSEEGKLGIFAGGTIMEIAEMGYFDIVEKKYGFFESFSVGTKKLFNQIGSYWQQLEKIFTPSTGAYKGVGGFKAIFDIFPSTWSWQAFWGITAFLSIMLAILNLLPIPALDGGHVMFLIYEMATGRKPTDKFLEYAQMVGFFLLLGLIIFANGNDIYKAVFK